MIDDERRNYVDKGKVLPEGAREIAACAIASHEPTSKCRSGIDFFRQYFTTVERAPLGNRTKPATSRSREHNELAPNNTQLHPPSSESRCKKERNIDAAVLRIGAADLQVSLVASEKSQPSTPTIAMNVTRE